MARAKESGGNCRKYRVRAQSGTQAPQPAAPPAAGPGAPPLPSPPPVPAAPQPRPLRQHRLPGHVLFCCTPVSARQNRGVGWASGWQAGRQAPGLGGQRQLQNLVGRPSPQGTVGARIGGPGARQAGGAAPHPNAPWSTGASTPAGLPAPAGPLGISRGQRLPGPGCPAALWEGPAPRVPRPALFTRYAFSDVNRGSPARGRAPTRRPPSPSAPRWGHALQGLPPPPHLAHPHWSLHIPSRWAPTPPPTASPRPLGPGPAGAALG